MSKMTIAEMRQALATGFNKQGRTVSESMRVKYLATIQAAETPIHTEQYKGFEIVGRGGRWFAEHFPVVFPSRKQAVEAVDHCLAIREELADEITYY